MTKKSIPRFNENLPDALSTETAKSIIKEIKKWVNQHSNLIVDYERWYCGITNHPPTRKAGHKYDIEAEPYAWQDFNAKSRRIAEAIETYFHNLGMKDHDTKGGSAQDSKYIYVYKKHPTWFD
ncbi:MAG: hypothetical protein HY062_01270 [Bacteroidetes bacterium]|nr:hypothetical protein [Bacteroidota bacterium]